MANIKIEYGTSTAMTITLASLASGSARQSTAVDNTSNKFEDAMVVADIKLATGTPAGDQCLYFFAFASEDGTNYTDNAGGTDAAITLRVPSNLRPLGVTYVPTSGGLTYKSAPMSVAAAFGGILPRKWGIVVYNQSGVALDATGGNHSVRYTGIYHTVV